MKTTVVREFLDGLLHLFFPLVCEGCSRALLDGEQVLCLQCLLQLPQTHYHHLSENETALKFKDLTSVANATSFAYFINDGLLQHLIHELKYRNNKVLGYYLGQQFGVSLSEVPWVKTIDLLVPVPLHASKLEIRGYNQSMLIAEGLGRQLGIPASDTSLKRVKSREERVANVAKAFVVAEKGSLAGKHVALVDDVLTTGATLASCVAALSEEENVTVSILTLGIVM
jgi:ComF family protein